MAAVNPDGALFSSDFRAPERLFGLVMQAGALEQLPSHGGSGCAAALAAVRWLMAQFGNSTQTAIAAYVYHVRDGVDLPSVWEQLQSQLYLNDAEFAEVLGRKMDHKLVADAEIPRLQRRTSAPPLAWLAAMPERNTAIVRGYATGCYTLKEVALAFEIHYATVSRIVKKGRVKKYECKT